MKSKDKNTMQVLKRRYECFATVYFTCYIQYQKGNIYNYDQLKVPESSNRFWRIFDRIGLRCPANNRLMNV